MAKKVNIIWKLRKTISKPGEDFLFKLTVDPPFSASQF